MILPNFLAPDCWLAELVLFPPADTKEVEDVVLPLDGLGLGIRFSGTFCKVKSILKLVYCKSSIRSRPSIILDTKFHRLVLEVLKRLQFLEQKDFSWATKGPLETPKISKKYYFYVF